MSFYQQTRKQYDSAKTPEEQKKLQGYMQGALSKIEALDKEAERVEQPVASQVSSSPLAEQAKRTATTLGQVAEDVGTGLVGGAKDAMAGIVSAPYELPAMAVAAGEEALEYAGLNDPTVKSADGRGIAYNMLTGGQGAFQPKTTFESIAADMGGAAVIASPALLGGPVVAGSVFLAELIRRTSGRLIRQYGGDGQITETVATGLEMVPIVPYEVTGIARSVKAPRNMEQAMQAAEEQRAQILAQNSAEAARLRQREALKGEQNPLGLSYTEGMITGDRQQLAIENSLATSGQGGVIVDLNVENANKVKQWVERTNKILNTGSLSTVALGNRVMAAYETYKADTYKAFRDKKNALFNNIPDTVQFNSAPLVAKIDEVIDVLNLEQSTLGGNNEKALAGLNALRNGLMEMRPVQVKERYRDPDSKITRTRTVTKMVPTGNKNLSAQELQSILQDIGQLSYTGQHRNFGDVAVGQARYIGGQLSQSIKGVLDEAAEQGDEAAQALLEARKYFAEASKDMKIAGLVPIITILDKPEMIHKPEEIVNELRQMNPASYNVAVKILEKEAPEVIPALRAGIIEDIIDGTGTSFSQKVRGSGATERSDTYNIPQMIDQLDAQLSNNVLFSDAGSQRMLNEMKALLPSIERAMSLQGAGQLRFEDAGLIGKARRLSRMGTEIAGVLFDTQGRYAAQVLERVTEETVRLMSDPQAVALAAVSPGMPQVIKRVIDRKTMSREELKKLDAWTASYKLKIMEQIGEDQRERDEEITEGISP